MSARTRKYVPETPVEKKRILIAVPAGDSCSTGFAYDLASMVGATIAQCPTFDINLDVAKGTVLPSLRNSLANDFLSLPDATHILWLDSDMRFPKDTLIRLLAHNKDIVGASYVTRRFPIQPISFDENIDMDNRLFVEPDATGLIEAGATGMGCLLMTRKVFEKTEKPWFVIGYNPASDSFQGEDIFMMVRAGLAGFPTFIDCDLSKQVKHVGEYEYTYDEAWRTRDGLREMEKEPT